MQSRISVIPLTTVIVLNFYHVAAPDECCVTGKFWMLCLVLHNIIPFFFLTE